MPKRRMVETPDSLRIYPGMLGIVLSYLLAGMGVVAFVVQVGKSASEETLAGCLAALLLFGGIGTWLLFAKPVLDIDRRGIRAPLLFQPETAGWGRVAIYRKGAAWGQNSLDVVYWKDKNDHSQGYDGGLHIPAMLLPARVDTVIAAIGRVHERSVREG